jgi:hypothetical protein
MNSGKYKTSLISNCSKPFVYKLIIQRLGFIKLPYLKLQMIKI